MWFGGWKEPKRSATHVERRNETLSSSSWKKKKKLWIKLSVKKFFLSLPEARVICVNFHGETCWQAKDSRLLRLNWCSAWWETHERNFWLSLKIESKIHDIDSRQSLNNGKLIYALKLFLFPLSNNFSPFHIRRKKYNLCKINGNVNL